MQTVFEMTKDEWAAVGEMLDWVKQTIDTERQPVGYNIKVNCGKAAGQEIMHAHLHLIPKY